MQIPAEAHKNLRQRLHSMKDERYAWWNFWRDLARHIFPRRYIWLESENEVSGKGHHTPGGQGTRKYQRAATLRNPELLDSTSTLAARTLASGMLNGITSPARAWFGLQVQGFPEDGPEREWLDECSDIMLRVIAETNFYNSIGVVYMDLVAFGTAAMTVYEDYEDVFRCYNHALGEYYLQQDNRQIVRRFCRTFHWRVEQIVREFGLDNVSPRLREAWNARDHRKDTEYEIVHMIEPNDEFSTDMGIPATFPFREVYYESGAPMDGKVLRVRGFTDWPCVCPRWEIIGNDSYGTGPSADALADIRQLQHMTKRKAQAMDKLISPPVVADIQLQNRPSALMPNGITYVAGTNNVGVKPIYTINPPLQEMNLDIERLRSSIREIFHNDLFRMIANLDTVRTATEIDARREEKLVLLGPVLERFENEALDPVIRRIFSICQRRGLFPEPPPSLINMPIDIEYVSLLSDAQRAVGAQPIERFVTFMGTVGQAVPEVMEVPNWEELTRDYAHKIGVRASNINDRETVAERRQLRELLEGMQAAGEAAQPAAQAAEAASNASPSADNVLGQLLGRGT